MFNSNKRFYYPNDTLSKRILLLMFTSLILFGLIGVRLLFIQIFSHKDLITRSKVQKVRRFELIAERGEISDRNGITTAIDINEESFYIDTNFKRNFSPNAIEFLARVLESDPYELEKRINEEHGLLLVKENIEPSLKSVIRRGLYYYYVDEGVLFRKEPVRTYPWHNTGSTLIGAIGTDHCGLEGIEYLYNNKLSGKNGIVYYMVNPQGDYIHNSSYDTPLTQGHDLQLTIDLFLTKGIYKYISNEMQKKSHITAAFAFLADIDTQEVLASVSLPDYDPNVQSSFKPEFMADRNVRQVFLPGKALDLLSAIALNKLNLKDIVLDGYNFYDCNFTNVNVFRNDINRQVLETFGFGQKINIDFSGQDEGFLPSNDSIRYVLDKGGNIGDVVVCNPIQFAGLYIKAFLNQPFIPRVILNETHVSNNRRTYRGDTNKTASKTLPNNMIIHLSGSTELGYQLFAEKTALENQYKNLHKLKTLSFSVGWFIINKNRYIMFTGTESRYGECKADSKILWSRIRDIVSDYYSQNAYMIYPLLQHQEFFNQKMSDLVNNCNQLKSDILRIRNEGAHNE